MLTDYTGLRLISIFCPSMNVTGTLPVDYLKGIHARRKKKSEENYKINL